VLEDTVWCKLAARSEVLCAECCFKRADERDIDLTRANLRLCVLNLAGWPFSYFNLLREAKKVPCDRRALVCEKYLSRSEVGNPVEIGDPVDAAHQDNPHELERQVRAS
jgi:hypothetical protein